MCLVYVFLYFGGVSFTLRRCREMSAELSVAVPAVLQASEAEVTLVIGATVDLQASTCGDRMNVIIFYIPTLGTLGSREYTNLWIHGPGNPTVEKGSPVSFSRVCLANLFHPSRFPNGCV